MPVCSPSHHLHLPYLPFWLKTRLAKRFAAMSSDGCQKPAWTGSPFSYLMHQPASGTSSYKDAPSAVIMERGPSAGAGKGAQAATGVWDGPAPRTQQRGATPGVACAAAVAPAQERQPDAVPLPGGKRLPLLGFGTYKVDGVDSIRAALEAGYRHLDCAPLYGNEALVGEAIAPWISEHGRDSLFLTTKIWNTAHRPELARKSVLHSLKGLGVDKVDLLLMHWPDAWTPDSTFDSPQPDTTVSVLDTWRAMEQLVDEGKVSHLGVSNFSEKALVSLLVEARIKPLANQVELHPLLAQRRLVGACLRLGVVCVAYCPLGHSGKDLLANPEVAALAESVGRSPAQVLLRWNVQRGVVVLPKASSAGHMLDNIRGLFDWYLSHDQKARMDALDKSRRFVDFKWHSWDS